MAGRPFCPTHPPSPAHLHCRQPGIAPASIALEPHADRAGAAGALDTAGAKHAPPARMVVVWPASGHRVYAGGGSSLLGTPITTAAVAGTVAAWAEPRRMGVVIATAGAKAGLSAGTRMGRRACSSPALPAESRGRSIDIDGRGVGRAGAMGAGADGRVEQSAASATKLFMLSIVWDDATVRSARAQLGSRSETLTRSVWVCWASAWAWAWAWTGGLTDDRIASSAGAEETT